MTPVQLERKHWKTARSWGNPGQFQLHTLSPAQRLQRRGLTLSEIARELDQPRIKVAQELYYDQVSK